MINALTSIREKKKKKQQQYLLLIPRVGSSFQSYWIFQMMTHLNYWTQIIIWMGQVQLDIESNLYPITINI